MKTLRTCEEGHRYYKSSDCPVCPICANEDKPDNFLGKLSAPARRALMREGITTIELLANYSEEKISNLHGIGRNALDTLRSEMNKSNITYKS
ncbi:MAG: DNA-directed RNA polymerase subunit alpha C-terminal domain-containing protein [Marinoscillum sp.]